MLNHQSFVGRFSSLSVLVERLSRVLSTSNRVQIVLFISWLLLMISLPIVRWVWGEAAVIVGVLLSVVLQASLVVAILLEIWGIVETARVSVIVMLVAFVMEVIGTATGFPFGGYRYTELLQPQLIHVPLLIPLAWLMMLPAAWVVAYQIIGRTSGLVFIGLSSLAMTAWDLFLDPHMVAWGLWIWANPEGYFGIPWVNFLGWAMTAALVTTLARPKPLPSTSLFSIYLVVWLLETGGLIFFWGLPGPGLVGFLGMGSLVFLAWWKWNKRT